MTCSSQSYIFLGALILVGFAGINTANAQCYAEKWIACPPAGSKCLVAVEVPCPTPARPPTPRSDLGNGRASSNNNANAPTPSPADTQFEQGKKWWEAGNWQVAIWHFEQALKYRPNDPTLLAWLNDARKHRQAQLDDIKRREEEEANQRRAENLVAILTRDLKANDPQAEAMNRVLTNTMGDIGSLPFSPPSAADAKAPDGGGLSFSDPNVVNLRDATVYYPALLRALPPKSIAVKVLDKRQPDIRELDQKIHQAQDALRRLIRSNQQSEEARKEWTAQSLDATYEAEWVGLHLFVDALDAYVGELAPANSKEKAEILNRLLSRGEEAGQSKSLHNIYGMLLNEMSDLDRMHSEARLAHKEYDLAKKMNEMDRPEAAEFTLEDFHDIVTQIKKIEDIEGPSKDLVVASYTIYKQASSLERMLEVEGNQVKSLQAATQLQKYVETLVKQRRAAKAEASVR